MWPTIWRMSLTVRFSYLATLPTAKDAESDTSPTGRQLRRSLRNPAHSLKGA